MDELKYRMIAESAKGGPAYYRAPHLATNPYAKYRDEVREAQQLARGRVVCVKLPWVFAIIKLPVWSPIGTLLE